jgi:proline dehydrogenase
MGLMRSAFLAGSRSVWLRERAMRYGFVRRSVSRFMPGEGLADALEAARVLQEWGASSVLTQLGENVADADEADAVKRHYLDVLDRAAARGLDGQISVKPTQLGLDLDRDMCRRNLNRLVDRAGERDNFVWIDMESSPYVDPTLDLFRGARARSPRVGVALQAYLFRTAADVEALLPLGSAIRLVKGAYLEPPSIAYPRKADVDENFYRLACRLLSEAAQRAGGLLHVATHDGRLVDRLKTFIWQQKVPKTAYEYAMLYGIQRPLQQRLVQGGEPLRVLIAYGEYWFPWYMRRLAERPANVGFVVRNIFAR